MLLQGLCATARRGGLATATTIDATVIRWDPAAAANVVAVAVSDGNGWVECRCGSRHWGKFGAAGLLLIHSDLDGAGIDAARRGPLPQDACVLLQHRAAWSHQGDTWGLPGGARDSGESSRTAALREVQEEAQIDAAPAEFLGVQVTNHTDWHYTTVLMLVADAEVPTPNRESNELRWVPVSQVWASAAGADVASDAGDDIPLPLHPGFASSWPLLAGPRTRLLVDVANVMGSRPDGWWRDRAAAAQRLVAQLEPVPGAVQAPDGSLIDIVHAAIEGKGVHASADNPALIVTRDGTADDALARIARSGDLVVTADRGLRERVTAVGAEVIGPSWLLDLIDRLGKA